MFKNKMKHSILVFASLGLLLSGCGDNTDEANAYNIEKWLDSGDNQKVIDALGDCSSYSGSEKENCYLNLGAAFFGKAKFDMISLSKEFASVDDDLSDDNKSKEFNKIVFKKLDDLNLKEGLIYYKKVLPNDDSSICNAKAYDENLSKIQKQACISINPLLLSKIVNDENNDTNKSDNSVSLEQIIQFKDVLKDAAPEIESEDLVSIISGDELSDEKDADNNDVIDSVQATQVVLDNVNNGTSSSFIKNKYTNVYSNSKLSGVDYYELQFADATSNKYFRLTQAIENTSPVTYTTLSTIKNEVCDINNTKTTGTINGTTILPCVKIKEDGNVSSFNDSIVSIINNDNLINSIALASDSEGSKTDEEKISEYKNDICDINGTASSSNNGLCDVDANGNITITQEALIDYMNEKK